MSHAFATSLAHRILWLLLPFLYHDSYCHRPSNQRLWILHEEAPRGSLRPPFQNINCYLHHVAVTKCFFAHHHFCRLEELWLRVSPIQPSWPTANHTPGHTKEAGRSGNAQARSGMGRGPHRCLAAQLWATGV